MPKSDSRTKADRHYLLQKLFEQPGQRLRTGEIAKKLGVSDDTVKHDIDELSVGGRLPLRKDGQYWILAEHAHVEQLQVHLNIAEATSLYIAGRLLSQIHDGQNRHVILALTKLLNALPQPLQEHQRFLIEMAQQRQQKQVDRSGIFEALAIGWAVHRKVRLLYEPPRKRKFECLFSPYLLEPSGIGRTIYAMGESAPPEALRTYKLERIQSAHLTDDSFTLPDQFDGSSLLNRSWGVMYGEEDLVEVRLRFSHYVTKRVKETLWHHSQQIVDTPEGCEWSVSIGDTLEIENWIRSWGSDCEVLSPPELRENIIADILRSSNKYALIPAQSTDDEDLLIAGALLARRLHQMVHLTGETYADTTFITCAEYQIFLDEQRVFGRYCQPDHWTSYHFSPGQGHTPVLGIRSSDARAFCEWLTERDFGHWSYRLPRVGELEDEMLLGQLPSGMGYWLEKNEKFAWVNGDSELPTTPFQEAIVELFLSIDLALEPASTFINNIEDNRDYPNISSLALDRTSILIKNLDGNPDLFRPLSLALVRALDLAKEKDTNFINDLIATRNLAINLQISNGFVPNLSLNLQRIGNLPYDLVSAFDRELTGIRNFDQARMSILQIVSPLLLKQWQKRTQRKIAFFRSKQNQFKEEETQRSIRLWGDLYMSLIIIEERIKSNFPTYEGILIVKE